VNRKLWQSDSGLWPRRKVACSCRRETGAKRWQHERNARSPQGASGLLNTHATAKAPTGMISTSRSFKRAFPARFIGGSSAIRSLRIALVAASTSFNRCSGGGVTKRVTEVC
jgi:hypothetical protein